MMKDNLISIEEMSDKDFLKKLSLQRLKQDFNNFSAENTELNYVDLVKKYSVKNNYSITDLINDLEQVFDLQESDDNDFENNSYSIQFRNK